MKKFFYKISIVICLLICSTFMFSGCGVVPCAWVMLDMEGYVVYTSNMYASGGDHVYLYETESDAETDTYRTNYLIAIVFYPRILGVDTVNEKRTTTVDVSSWYSMTVYVNKDGSIYNSNKKVYLNDEVLDPSNTYNGDSLLGLTFDNFTFVRGNPNGHFNEFVNRIEYKL